MAWPKVSGLSVMAATLGDFEQLLGSRADHTIDEPMLLIDTARPPTGVIVFERFGMSDAFGQVLIPKAEYLEKLKVALTMECQFS